MALRCRMHPKISAFPRHEIYNGRVSDGANVRQEGYGAVMHGLMVRVRSLLLLGALPPSRIMRCAQLRSDKAFVTEHSSIRGTWRPTAQLLCNTCCCMLALGPSRLFAV